MSEDNLYPLVLSVYHMPTIEKDLDHRNKCLYLLSHSVGLDFLFVCLQIGSYYTIAQAHNIMILLPQYPE